MAGPKFQRGDILHTFSPHTENAGRSKHWAIVVGDPLDCSHGDYVLIQITSTLYSGRTDFRLLETHPEFAATGLDHASTFRCHKIFPISESMARTKLGEAGPSIMGEIELRLRSMLRL